MSKVLSPPEPATASVLLSYGSVGQGHSRENALASPGLTPPRTRPRPGLGTHQAREHFVKGAVQELVDNLRQHAAHRGGRQGTDGRQ